MEIFKLSDKATIPTRNNPTDAGLDLYSAESLIIPKGKGTIIKTDISIKLPSNVVGMICDRSSMGKKGLKVHGGIVDETYIGNIMVALWNHSDSDYEIKENDKIAQLLIIPILTPEPKEVFKPHDPTDRGDKGFGSSGR